MTADLRKRMRKAAIKAAEAVGYVNAGTIEFLVDDAGNFYFIEMNTRVQVEHPVTEEATGIDIVKEQIRIAAGEHLGYGQKAIQFQRCAIEVRINAEDPFNDFRPSPGQVTFSQGSFTIPESDTNGLVLVVLRPTVTVPSTSTSRTWRPTAA